MPNRAPFNWIVPVVMLTLALACNDILGIRAPSEAPDGGLGGTGGASSGAGGTHSIDGAGGSAGVGAEGGAGGTHAGGTTGSAGITGTAGGAGGGNVGSGNGGAAGTGIVCGETNAPIMPLPPDILVIEDRSGSMNDDDTDTVCPGGCGATSKWALVTAAINNVTSLTDTTVNWGLKFFADADDTCGVNSPGVAVPIAPMSSAAIATAITGATSANGGLTNGSLTPTAKAVTAGVAYLTTLTDPNPKYLLLATDGLPNCAVGNNNNADDSGGAEQAVAAALTTGFQTFVVGIATTTDTMATATLNTMAINGGQAQTDTATMYYAVTDTASLEVALSKIVGIVAANCTISLAGAPTNFTNVAVSATDSTGTKVQVMQDATNGWAYDATRKNIVLNGTACDSLKNGSYSSLSLVYSDCNPPTGARL